MTQNQADPWISTVIKNLTYDPGSPLDTLDMIAMGDMPSEELISVVSKLKQQIEETRLTMVYLLFDLEATRRERDWLTNEQEEEG